MRSRSRDVVLAVCHTLAPSAHRPPPTTVRFDTMFRTRPFTFGLPIVFAAAAQAAERVHEARLESVEFGANAAVVVPRFDPELGRLQRVEIELTSVAQGSAGFENLGAAPCTADTTVQSTVHVLVPNSTNPVVAFRRAGAQFALGGFDGARDFAGSSGHVLPAMLATSGAAAFETGLGAFVAERDDDVLTLPVHLRGGFQLQGVASAAIRESWSVQVIVRVRYVYAPR